MEVRFSTQKWNITKDLAKAIGDKAGKRGDLYSFNYGDWLYQGLFYQSGVTVNRTAI